MTLVSAGPGTGKTLTLASWTSLGSAPGAVAWLTLDETDNDLQAFWSDVLGALAISGALPPGSPLVEVVPAAGFRSQQAVVVCAGLADLPAAVTAIAWAAQLRLSAKFKRLVARRVMKTKVVVAIARELAGFIWAIGREVQISGWQGVKPATA